MWCEERTNLSRFDLEYAAFRFTEINFKNRRALMPAREITSLEELRSLVGQEVAVGDWFEVTQDRINQFAEATGDHQWIHLDTERAKSESPYGTTIAHGFLTLSLLSHLRAQTVQM